MGSKSTSKTAKGNKQNGTKSNSGKLQAQETQIEKEQNGDPHTDFSMLRKPIDISVTGVGQVVKIYQTATAEVRQLLAYECDLVYECKVCRNLFRSLANFLSHKRVYCREQYSDTKHVFPANHLVEDRTTIIQPEAVPPSSYTETWVTSDAKNDTGATGSGNDSDGPSSPHIETSVPRIAAFSNPKKDLSQIVERLAQKRSIKTVTETVGHISASKFYESVSDQVTAQRDARKEHVIRLEAIENTTFGVFQTVLQSSSTHQMENTDLMKTQVVELHNMMTCNEATLGPDGQIATMNGEGGTPLAITENSEEKDVVSVKKQESVPNKKGSSPKENHVCTICNTRFSTRKTLNHHMKSLHVTFRMCYPCPCCKNTFCNTWSVYRHLYKVHRKTTIQVRKLRSQIVNKAFRKEVSDYESQNSNGKSTAIAEQTEADKARKEQQRLHQENQAWMNNFEDDLELQMCGGCGRRFERRAALNSHSQICQKRIAIQNNIKARRPSPSISTTSNSSRVTSTKSLPTSTDKQQLPRTENSKNDNTCVESNSSRLTPVSVLSENMLSPSSVAKGIVTPSPSPVPTDISNQSVQLLSSSTGTSYHRTRHCSGSRADCTKKDVPEKRIEIQIRRDYCKTGSGSVNTAMGTGGPSCQQPDSNSETNESLLPSGDTGEGTNHDEINSVNGDSEVHDEECQSRDSGSCFVKKGSHLVCEKLDGNVGLDVCSYEQSDKKETVRREGENITDGTHKVVKQDENDNGSSIELEKDIGLNIRDNKNETTSLASEEGNACNKTELIEKQNVFLNSGNNRNTRQGSDVIELQDDTEKTDGSPHEQPNESTPPASTKKEEQFSPIMENRMQSMINIRRLQCLPCQKKFNKLTNLRRHVAVHIGWNRYRCIECTFKCFSKYDCVAHVNKMHLAKADRERAQAMVQYIETQATDTETEGDMNILHPTENTHNVESEENDENMTQITNINLSNKFIPTSKSIAIINNTSSDKVSAWSELDCDGSKIDTSSDFNVSDIQNSVVVDDGEENYLHHALNEDGREKNDVLDLPIKEDSITVNDTPSIVEIMEKENDISVIDTAEEEISKLTVPVSSLRLRPKRCHTSNECCELEPSETVPSKKLLTAAEYHNTRNVASLDIEENDAHKAKATDKDTEPDINNDSTPSAEISDLQMENPSDEQQVEEQNLRRMVFQVIFGSSNSSMTQDLEATHNMFSVAMNGEHCSPGGSASSPEPYDVVETVSCDSTSPLTTNSSATSPLLTSDDAASVVTELTSNIKDDNKNSRQSKTQGSAMSMYDTERRQRPVRNRVKVEREDFIYDLSDRCLDPKRDAEDRSSHNSKVSKRRQDDRTRDSVKTVLEKGNCNVPKLMLIRTNIGEYSGVKVSKSSSSSNMTQVFDSNNGKSNSSSTVSYNISTRKSQRTYDVTPHKSSNQQ